jgi:hypothetical protein
MQVSSSFPGANGLLKWDNKLYVGDCKTAVVRSFEIEPSMTLKPIMTTVRSQRLTRNAC